MDAFNPNGVGLNNGHFIGLPFDEEDARVVALSVPWDVTVSSGEGTALGPENILKSSLQLDLFQNEIENAWKLGLHVRKGDSSWLNRNEVLRPLARQYIQFLEEGGKVESSAEMQKVLDEINVATEEINEYVYQQSKLLLKKDKLPALVGGDHSCPLGLMKALSEKYSGLGVLHIDAHMDLRNAYEGFIYSHASVFYNAISLGYVSNLVQVGVRDFCEEEVQFAQENGVKVYTDDDLKEALFTGENWKAQCARIIKDLPEAVYVSFDIDGLNPHLCSNTGTPVPGGLEYSEAIFLIKELVKSGRKIVGFDLCEVAGKGELDGNVGARVLYTLSCWAGRSQGWI